MFDDLYNKRILELAAHIPLLGKLDKPDGIAVARAKLCGSMVSVQLKMQNGHVTEFAHEVKACALGQASSSIMASHVIGATLQELELTLAQMRAMLKDNGAPPTGRFEDAKVLQPVRDFKPRHASVLLTFEATVEAVWGAINKTNHI